MIITMTGKPCSGKSAVIEYLIAKYGFSKFSAGAIYRRIAEERGIDVLELNRSHDTSVDKIVDDEIVRVGKRDADKMVIFDSRIAWKFVPVSFKVFLDIEPDEQVRRLLGSGRTNEKVDISPEEAKNDLEERWNLENDRYMEIYGFDNRTPSNYDLVVDTTNLTIEETGEKIYSEYLKFTKNK